MSQGTRHPRSESASSQESRYHPPSYPDSPSRTEALNRSNYEAARLLKRGLQESASRTTASTSYTLPYRGEPTRDDENLQDEASGARKTPEEMSKPVLFYGKPSQLDQVLTFATVKYLADGTTTDKAKCGYLASLFRGTALNWLTSQIARDEDILDNYEDFLAAVKDAFALDESAKKAQAARQLANLRQKGSVQDYALKFQDLALDAGLNAQTAIAYFTKGLKPAIRSALIISDERSTLADAVTEAVRIDSQLYYAGGSRGGFSGPRKSRDRKGRFTKSKPIKEEFEY